MKLRNVVLALGFLTASVGIAQGPLYDRVLVNLPYPVSVNGTVLQPGEYEIRQHESTAGGSRIVHFFRDGGMKLETTAMAIPALDNRTPEETKLVLDRFGSDYYLNKIWVQGKDYGYEFPIPDSVRLRENERMASTNITATYQGPATTTTETAQSTTTETTTTETAQATPPPEPAPAPAEAAPAPAPAAQAEVTPAPAPETTPAPMAADRPAQTMPATAGNWLNLLLGGGLLTGSGLALRRFLA
jgi:hypothetical protein